MQRIAGRIVVLWGWRRLVAAIAAGALSALAFAPFDLAPILFVTLPVFVWLLDGAVGRDGAGPVRNLLPAAAVGWGFGFGFFTGGLWWLGAAFLVDAEDFAFLMPLAVIGLPAALALLFAAGAALARLFWPEGWPRILVFAAAMTLAEYARGHLLTGFPWNAFGYALTPTPVFMQSASLVGLWGLTLAAFLVFAAPAALGDAGRAARGRLGFLAVAGGLLALHAGFGAIRLSLADRAILDGVRIRIVQPAISQNDRWQTENEEEIVRRYLTLSDGATSPERSGVGSATLLVWPESAFPFLLTERPEMLAAIAELLPEGTTLVTGAARGEPTVSRDDPPRVFNSVYVIGHDGAILDAYDKVHLVPFGEYLPARGLLESVGIRQLIAIPGGFSAGSRRRNLSAPGGPSFAPLICYEIVFPGEALAAGDRPDFLLNLTNDAWYGDTPGPHQHLRQSVVRAVEEGLPLVRAANSGISAIADAYGRIDRSLGLDVSGILDGDLPAKIFPTVYGRLGDWILAILLGFTIVFAVVFGTKGPRRFN